MPLPLPALPHTAPRLPPADASPLMNIAEESMAVPTSMVYQFKVALRNQKPPIWRRIQVPEDYTFFQLHLAIRSVMGWSDQHLHQFEMDPKSDHPTIIALRKQLFDLPGSGMVDERTAKIAHYFTSTDTKCLYTYDLGFSWYHNVTLEKVLPASPKKKYPHCVTGRRQTPKEDVTEEEHEMLIYMGGYDPDEPKFDPKSIVFIV